MRSAVRLITAAMLVAWMGALTSCGAVDAPKGAAAPTDTKAPAGETKPVDAPKSAEGAQDWPPKGVKVAGPDEPKTPAPEPKVEPPDMKKVSYCIGLSMGTDICQKSKASDVAIDAASLLDGMKEGLSGAKGRYTEEEIMKIMESFQTAMVAQQTAKMKKLSEENKVKGDAYLAENRKKEGVKTTASGLQYRVVKTGTGKQAKKGDTVSVGYKGSFIDGIVFDSSYERGGEPATFTVGEVIEGWNEALQLMREGDTWELVIPPGLAYGEGGRRPIPPNSVLVFTVELKKVGAPQAEEMPKDMPKDMPK